MKQKKNVEPRRFNVLFMAKLVNLSCQDAGGNLKTKSLERE